MDLEPLNLPEVDVLDVRPSREVPQEESSIELEADPEDILGDSTYDDYLDE